ncbi:MAG: NMT1/THI5 like domain-containing protein [Deltaproteobacteria bacterium]|nr:NMT1/THI5 like domain-containing protein [Deltaproteobacteria bacterium]
MRLRFPLPLRERVRVRGKANSSKTFPIMKKLNALAAGWLFLCLAGETSAAEKIRVAFVSPVPGFAPAWIAKETGMFARQGLDADVILLTGSPRLVQSLIAGDVDYAIVGATATIRARMRGADVAILAATTNVSSQKLLVGQKSGIRRLEDLKGRVVGVSQYGSEADAFARIVANKAGLRPDKDVAIIQLGGHPQVAAALVAGKIEAGVIGGLAFLTAQKSGAVVLATAVDLQTVSLGPAVAVTGRSIQRSRDSVTRFMRGFVEAFQYLRIWAGSASSRRAFSMTTICLSLRSCPCREKKGFRPRWISRLIRKPRILSRPILST